MKNDKPFLPALRRSIAIIGSQDKAAAATGFAQTTISRWLSGTVTKLPYDAPMKFERATNRKVKAAEFFG